ncbi:hypothetical protein FOA43_002092 [Brettanomyces nanus]|uniref:Uncharacterized protein n=1 Tax=Eeniella nana TaxID=13502 RepID=A0A875S4R4_EENNA|nr:uncharacterized protein FOA43_002092 [Brettanomyces nanus]QPG74759.1 hypothetical protein FOA43_002092 [Brettanomyces nanus]
MVLFKRKQVEFVPPPSIPNEFDPDQPVWLIPETGEWFIEYEDYLRRMSYYKIKKFVCETSGNSNFTYFEALKVERNELRLMETKFPDPIKEPILRYVSFSTVPRIDVMVDDVYTRFKEDFFPGDQVIVKGPHEKFRGIVREKARFNPIQLPDGTVRDGYCSYRVLLETNEEITVNDSSRMSRERNTFTKWFVKSFLKMSLTRANRSGAPWVLKETIAQKYRIPLEYPAELRHFEAELAAENDDTNKSRHGRLYVDDSSVVQEPPATSTLAFNLFDDVKETPPTGSEQENGRNLQEWKDKWYEVLQKATAYFDDLTDEEIDPDLLHKVESMFEFAGVTRMDTFVPGKVNFYITPRTYSSRVHYEFDDDFSSVHLHKIKVWHYEKCIRFFKSINITPRKIEQARLLAQMPGADIADVKRLIIANRNYPQSAIQQKLPVESQNFLNKLPTIHQQHQRHANKPTKPPSPIEDLDLAFTGYTPSQTSHWKYLEAEFGDPSILLGIWIFMNMYNKALIIDNFTFDDFCTALKWRDQEEPCQLLLEIFCSLMTALTDETGHLALTIPEELIEEDEEKEEKVKTKPEKSDTVEEEDHSDEITHNAYAIIQYRRISWKERLRKRQFKNGGWLIILLGIFSLVDYIPDYMDTINEIDCILAPGDYKPTHVTVENNFYESLSSELRVKALDILVSLLLNSSIIRDYIDKVAEDSSNLRRERFELIRQLKTKLEEAHDVQKLVTEALEEIDTTEIEKKLQQEKPEEVGKPETEQKPRRRGGRPSLNYIPPEPTELEKAVCLSHPEFLKLIKERSEKMKVIKKSKVKRKEIERQLNELNIQRMRYIGRDRYFNRYWWFERNGLPNLGSSVDEEGEGEGEGEDNEEEANDEEGDDDDEDQYISETYLMGRLWVQGPTDSDRKYHLHFSDEEMKVFEEKARGAGGAGGADGAVTGDTGHLSALERKVIEEGKDVLVGSSNWRFLDTVEDLQKLIMWLNVSGIREKGLRKEIVDLQELIKNSLKSRAAFLGIGMKSDKQLELEREITENKGEAERKRKFQELEERDIKRAKRGSRPAERIAKRQELRRHEKELEEKLEAREKLGELSGNRDRDNALLWVNSSALEQLQHTHYEGGKALKKTGKKKKRGRR